MKDDENRICFIEDVEITSVHIFSKKGQGGNDQKGHFC